ncbi:hypothetical protein LVJ94_25560 [Pendulispora rubella]|uniref:Uncharacterized protein n=1 Tax=Pendulispora rubella TaxID=2741070 RepID=A0ABZ2LI19_9BACT
MNARQKIESLTNAWYGFAVFSAAFYILRNGFGFFSLTRTMIVFLFSLVGMFFIGRRLLSKGHIIRFILLLCTAVATLTGTLGAGHRVLEFLGDWSFSLLLDAAGALVAVYMNARSFRVLTDSSVRAYFNS